MSPSTKLNDMTLTEAHDLTNIPMITLKVACQRYKRTGGEKGLRSTKKRGSRNWFVTMRDLQRFIDNEYNPRPGQRTSP